MPKKQDPFELVTDRDKKLVSFLAQGLSDKEIAPKMFIDGIAVSKRTVQGWFLEMKQRLKIKSRPQLTNEFCKRDLI